jgi:hypothetical protein
MPEYFYTTLENQLRSDGSYGLLYNHYTDLNQAYAKLYYILAAAATSGIPYHSGHIYRSDGLLIDGRVFDRRAESSEAVSE